MTPEQFRDARAALRALRRVKRWRDFNLPVATGDFESAIYRGKRDLPEYRAMLSAKAKCRGLQRQRQKVLAYRAKVGEENIVGGMDAACWHPILGWGFAAYREAREKFLERIGGEV